MFTRKHYKQVATILHQKRDQVFGNKEAMRAMIEVTESFADMFEADNPNFSRDRFMQACGLEQ